MQKEDCYYLGLIAKLHGFKGEVSLFLDVSDPAAYRGLDALFLDINGQLTPFFIQSFKLKNKGFAAVKFEGIETEDAARRLLKKAAYLPAEILPELDEVSFYDHEIIGYTVIDATHGSIGEVTDVIDMSANPLLQVMHNGKEILIPIFEGLVQKVGRKKKELYIKAPEGLIELYIA
ncbi:MAG: rRNA processing protein RimM [Bacteroidota bacterium]|jgi:16S rRNA processing protein RimM